jgi:hypothetical protein
MEMIEDDYNGGSNRVAYHPGAAQGMNWEQLRAEAAKLEEQDQLWQQAQKPLQLAGVFGRSDIMSPQARQRYREATGGNIDGEPVVANTSEGVQPQKFGIGGPNATLTKSQAELRNQAEMMVRNGRLGTVQNAMESIKADWIARGYTIK